MERLQGLDSELCRGPLTAAPERGGLEAAPSRHAGPKGNLT